MEVSVAKSLINTDEAQSQHHVQVSALIAETFADMIFRSGDVHCDPHAANMLVRRLPSAKQLSARATVANADGVKAGTAADGRNNGPLQLVLLDHGLYKQLDDPFRLNYARM